MGVDEEMTTTLTVPERHLALFRLAALHELGENADWVKGQEEEASRSKGRDVRHLAG